MALTKITVSGVPHFCGDWNTTKAATGYKIYAIVCNEGSCFCSNVSDNKVEPKILSYDSETGEYTCSAGWNLVAIGVGQEYITEITTLEGLVTTLSGDVDNINDVIPTSASSSNKLVDKSYVDSAISTSSAVFRGTSEPGLTTEGQFLTWANTLQHDLNDYVYWNTVDSNGNTVYKRYKYNGSTWVYEYDLNNSSFSAEEWEAIQSGITDELVAKLSALPSNVELTSIFNTKQNVIQDLSVIRNGAAAGATAYQLPDNGIPKADLSSIVQTSLNKADSAYQKPQSGIPKSDLTSGVQASLDKADSAYQKANTGIPKTDLSSAVQSSLDKADSALQQHQDITGKADKDTDATPGNVAKFDENGNPVDSGLSSENIARKDGSYDTMSVGLAKNLEGRTNVTDSFFERTTGGDAEVANGLAQMTEVGGNSVKFNQLVNTNTTSVATTSGRKYYTRISGTAGIVASTGSAIAVTGGVDNVIDLTAIFGSGNEPETVEDFEAWLASNIGKRAYYPYDPGSVLNVNMAGIETVGRNLLNPTTGKARILGAYSDVYGNYYGITGTHGAITFTSDMGETSTITPDEDGKFLLEEPGELSVADAGADCCVFLWWDGTQTDYAEHKDEKTYLDVTHIYGKLNGTGDLVRVWPTGMPKVNDIKDMLRIEDGQVVARRYVKEKELSAFTWSLYSADTTGHSFVCSIPSSENMKWVSNNSQLLNAMCGKYITAILTDANALMQKDKVLVGASNSNRLIIRDTSFSDAAAFDTSLSGDNLYAEAVTPEIYTDLVYQGSDHFDDGTPVTLPLNYNADNWGIEKVLPINTSEVLATAKPELTCKYSIDAVEMLNTHADEIEDLYDKNEELDAKKPNKTGDYPGMAVGSAKVLEGTDNKVEDFVFTAPQCADGIAKLNDVRGKSLVWNQYNDFSDSYPNGLECVKDNTEGSSSQYLSLWNYGAGIPSGHKIFERIVFERVEVTGRVVIYQNAHPLAIGGSGQSTNIVLDSSKKDYAVIGAYNALTPQNAAQAVFSIQAGASLDCKVKYMQCIDLTLMFGAGNEPATVEEFEALYPLLYYAYNAGEIISNKTEAVEVTGRNQWDEEREAGRLNYQTDGANNSLSGTRSKNYIRVLPGQSYYIRSIDYLHILEYAADKSYIGYIGARKNNEYTASANAAYVRFYSTVENYTYDICINFSDPSFNGQYEPYKKNTVTLNIPTLTGKLNGEGESVVVFPDGMRGAGTAYDKAAGKRGEVVMAEADLGDLAWSLYNNATHTFRAAVSGKKMSIGNLVSSEYALTGNTKDDLPDKGMQGINGYNYVYCRNDAYSDSAIFKAAMAGVKLIYELAEPLVYELDEGVPETFQAYKGGTLKQLPENGSEPTTAPCVMSVTYALDAVGILTGLPQNYVSKESLTAMLSAMQSAGLFASYTMTFNATTGKYEFTFTANS